MTTRWALAALILLLSSCLAVTYPHFLQKPDGPPCKKGDPICELSALP